MKPDATPSFADSVLEPMQYRADALADLTIAQIVGPWTPLPESATPEQSQSINSLQWQRIGEVNQLFQQWQTNRDVAGFKAQGCGAPLEVAGPLEAYLRTGRTLPPWANLAQVERAETLFMEYGALSCMLLFCSSLPECYVAPDLAAVLHVAGQLEEHTEYRIRATAAMIFPVMMNGGLTRPDGAGVAQVLKVRLIHATIRNLILRGSPQQALEDAGPGGPHGGSGPAIPPLRGLLGSRRMHQALFAHGWDLGRDGLPCNQEELAYTLLTFSYVFLRSLRRLGLGLRPADEEAYLHAWNVVGHVLGIQETLMAHSMEQAQSLFTSMQARARSDASLPSPRPDRPEDPRPRLASALMKTMEDVIPFRLLKPVPVLMTRFLCGRTTARNLGLTRRVNLVSRFLFWTGMLLVRCIDSVVRIFVPEFSISRLITRVLGYHFMTQLLLDQTRPLQLPDELLQSIDAALVPWSDDPKAPAWINRLEDRLTTSGDWKGTAPVPAAAPAATTLTTAESVPTPEEAAAPTADAGSPASTLR